jgi:RimJ/RimL family protein N-acetyltransferase
MFSMDGYSQWRRYGMWAVELKRTNHLIGRIGPQYPEGFPDVEVSWLLGKLYWGNGYATEGARTAI